MADLPVKSALTAGDTTEAAFASAIGDVYDYLAQLVGGSPLENLSILDGSIAPTKAFLIVDTENDTVSDNLDNIEPDELGEKIIILKIETTSRRITLRHMKGGSGELYLVGAADLLMDHQGCMIALRYNGDLDRWEELWRNFGLFAPTDAQKGAARASLSLGTAAQVDTGTDPEDVPTVSTLGALAFMSIINNAALLGDGVITNQKLAGGITLAKMAKAAPGSLFTFGPTGAPVALVGTGNATDVLRGDMTFGPNASAPVFTAGNNVQFSAPATVNAPNASWVKVVAVSLPRGGSVRVKYNFFKTGSTGSPRGIDSQLLVNGVQKATSSLGGTTVDTNVSIDLTELNPGDIVELQIKVQNSAVAAYIDANAKDFTICTAEAPLSFQAV